MADIEKSFNIQIEDDPFDYKKIINRPDTTITMISGKSIKSDDDDELIKRAIK